MMSEYIGITLYKYMFVIRISTCISIPVKVHEMSYVIGMKQEKYRK